MSDLNPYEEGLALELQAAQKRIEALTAEVARQYKLIAKMVPLSACGNYVFWDGVGDIELDHNGELRIRAEKAEADLAAAVKTLEFMNKVAGEVSRMGARTGPQWTRLSVALLTVRAALARLKGERT